MKINVSEHSIQVSILAFLELRGRRDIYWFAVPNAGKRSLRVGRLMKKEGLRSGVADLCFMFPGGITRWMESKTITGRQTDEQENFQEICVKLGHDYALVRSLDAAIAVLTQWRALR